MAKKKTNKKMKDDPMKQLQELIGTSTPKETMFYPTELNGLDRLLGGGIPTGKLIEINAEAGCGKTTVSLHVLRRLTELWGIKTAFFDIEKSVDGDFKRSLGLAQHEAQTDEDGRPKFLHLRLNTFSEAFQAMKTAFANDYKVIVWDSMTMTTTDAALDKDVEAEERRASRSRPGQDPAVDQAGGL